MKPQPFFATQPLICPENCQAFKRRLRVRRALVIRIDGGYEPRLVAMRAGEGEKGLKGGKSAEGAS